MTKELEIYLDKRIKDIKNYLDFNERSEDEKNFSPVDELQICYLAKEMLAIKEEEPSEALKCLETLFDIFCEREHTNSEHSFWLKNYNSIKQYILKAQEMEKVFEILKPLCKVIETPVRKDRYLKINGVVVYTFKSKEEYELLKEMLCDETN